MKTRIALVLALASILAGPMSAGDLEPPSAPAPTMKTLSQVEPRIPINDATAPGSASATYEIFDAGSYYLTENLVGEPGKIGLVVHAPDVSIDLNGFSVFGGPEQTYNVEPGIFFETGATAAFIHNGTVARWDNGILSETLNLTVHNVRCLDNSFDGLRAGLFSEVRGGLFSGNASEGLELGENSKVVGARAAANGYGIVVGGGSLVQDCVVEGNTNHGIRLNGPGSRVESSLATNNNVGISVEGDGCTVVKNTSTDNSSEGIASGAIGTTFYSQCVLDGNHVANNGARGILVTGTDNIIVRNMSQGNVTAYVIGAGNQVGTVVSAVDATGVNGSSGGNLNATIGPWANFAR